MARVSARSRRDPAADRGHLAAGVLAGRAASLLLALLLALGSPLPTKAAASGAAYRLGIFPYLPVLTIDRIFGPIAASFSKDLERPIYLKTKSNFEKFADELAGQSYDIIFVHPFFYVDAVDKYHYLPLARLDQPLTGVIMVGEDHSWHDWHDLVGKTLALPPELAAVTTMVKAALVEAGLRPGVDVLLQHYRTKSSCLQAVLVGSADACAVPRHVMSKISSIADIRLHVMIETAPINDFVFAVHERVPAADRAKLLACILSWGRTEAGRAVLGAGDWVGFVPARDQEYDEVRRYGTRLNAVVQR